MARVLIIDDDALMAEMLAQMVTRLGHQPTMCHTLKEGMDAAFDQPVDVILLDVQLPDGNGLEILPALQASPSRPEVIIITGHGDPHGAEIAFQYNAWDYLQKPFSPKDVLLALSRIFHYRRNRTATPGPAVALRLDGIVGRSPAMQTCLDLVAQAAKSDVNVLISGETGTGKELFARAIHVNSSRAQGHLVVVDCAALPETLLASVLFGHEKGAFTGAERRREGLVQQAHGGTLFLDEVGEMPPAVQKNFLRVLQEHRYRPLGASQEVASDFRLIAATNRDLEEMTAQGLFRPDLLFRLRAVHLVLPPLRQRPTDLKDLIFHYLAVICDKYGLGLKGLAPECLEVFLGYDWPGNTRELINTLEKAVAAAFYEPTLFPKHLPATLRITQVRAGAPVESARPPLAPLTPAPAVLMSYKGFRRAVLDTAERKYLEDLMAATHGHIAEACRQAGLSRARLYALLKKYGLSRRSIFSPE